MLHDGHLTHLCPKQISLSAITNILKLTRPLNLIIVILTMIIVRYSVLRELMVKSAIGMDYTLPMWAFVASVIAVICVTAAGNIINDYFDQKVDKINKPEKVVVGKKVKRRVAIVLHQGMNVLAVIMSLLVCYAADYYWPMAIPVLVITLLWWYSPILKKQVLIGNITVAACTAAVPLWGTIFEIHGLRESYADMLVNPDEFFQRMWLWTLALCFFAFILTLMREAVKDMEDISGDKAGDYHTLPIVHGETKTKQYVYALMIIYMMAAIAGLSRMITMPNIILFAVCILIPAVYAALSVHKASGSADYHKSSQYIKFMMAGGLLFLIWIF